MRKCPHRKDFVLEGLFKCSGCQKERWVTGRAAFIGRTGRDCGCGGKKGIAKMKGEGFIGGHGPENNNWKGGRSIRADGYVLVQIPPIHPFACMGRRKSGGWVQVFEHRLNMAIHLERPLKSEEIVHHIDHNPSNNDIKNLLLLPSAAEHSKLEYRESKEKMERLEKENAELKQEIERLKNAC